MSALASRRAIGDALGEFRLPAGKQSWANLVTSLSPSAWWRLGETSGTFADYSGNGYTGTMVGTLTRGAGGLILADSDAAIVGSGASSNYVDTTFVPNPAGDYTAFAWFTSVSGSPIRQGFISVLSGSGLGIQLLEIRNTKISTTVGGTAFQGGAAIISDGLKHFAVVTYQASTTTTTLYLDGVQVAQNATLVGVAAGGTLRIAANFNGAQNLNGTEDEVAYWQGTVLTPTQIANLYAAGA